MIFLPIVDRELRVRARLGTTYWGRCAAGAISAIVTLEAMASFARAVNPAALGAATFATLSWVGLALACASILMTFDSIGSERREGTLGLLFLTELGGADVVLGKLASSGLAAFYVLVCFLPGLALALLCGGVTAGALARTALALLNAIFIALAGGLLVSVKSHTRQKAMQGATLLALVLFVLPWLLAILRSGWPGLVPFLEFPSPYWAFHSAGDAAYGASPFQFWTSLCLAHCEGWALLYWAVISLERNWRAIEPERPAVQKPKVEKVAAQASVPPPDKELLERDPVCWVASRVPGRAALIWAGTVLLLVCVLAGTFFVPMALNGWSTFNLLLSLASASAFAWLAGRFFFDARRSGELELLLATPLGARGIIEGYWWAVWRHLRSPLLLVAFVTFVEFLFLFSSGLTVGSGLSVFQVVMVPLNRALDVVALSWAGMWFGLRARKPFLVVAWTAGLVIGLPWLVAYTVIIGSSTGFPAGLAALVGPTFWLAGLPLLYLLKNILIVGWAAARLQHEIRSTAPLAVGDWLK